MVSEQALTRWLNRIAWKRAPVRWFVGVAARYGSVASVVLLVALRRAGHTDDQRAHCRRASTRALFAVGCVYVIVELLGRAIQRARPFASAAGAHALLSHPPTRSFPSRHVASACAMAIVASPAHRGIGRTLGGIGLLLGLSRIGAGLHYPSDVLVGALLGIAVGRVLRGKTPAAKG